MLLGDDVPAPGDGSPADTKFPADLFSTFRPFRCDFLLVGVSGGTGDNFLPVDKSSGLEGVLLGSIAAVDHRLGCFCVGVTNRDSSPGAAKPVLKLAAIL